MTINSKSWSQSPRLSKLHFVMKSRQKSTANLGVKAHRYQYCLFILQIDSVLIVLMCSFLTLRVLPLIVVTRYVFVSCLHTRSMLPFHPSDRFRTISTNVQLPGPSRPSVDSSNKICFRVPQSERAQANHVLVKSKA